MTKKNTLRSAPSAQDASWTFLTNHAHVLICLARDPDIILRDVALLVGITERAVQRIITELEEGGYLERFKEGRRNTYRLSLAKPLRHPLEKSRTVAELIRLIK
jgi:DNA-binding MarR family transcriptional regulator